MFSSPGPGDGARAGKRRDRYGYVVATLLLQGTSHFALNAAHYAAVPHIRPEPLFAFGILSMLVQGAILSAVYAHRRDGDTPAARCASPGRSAASC